MSPGPVHVGAAPIIPEHGHAKRNDGGTLDAAIFLGRMPIIPSSVRRTGETAAIATAALVSAAAPGLWGVLAYIEVTMLTLAGTITLTIGWTDAVGATTDATIAGVMGAAGRIKGVVLPIEVLSGNVTYAVAIGTFTGTYNIRLVPLRFV